MTEPRLVMAHITNPAGDTEAEVLLAELTDQARLELTTDEGSVISLDWGELLDAIFARPATTHQERRAA